MTRDAKCDYRLIWYSLEAILNCSVQLLTKYGYDCMMQWYMRKSKEAKPEIDHGFKSKEIAATLPGVGQLNSSLPSKQSASPSQR